MGNTQNTPAQSTETTASDQAVNPYHKFQQEPGVAVTAMLDESKRR